MWKYPFPDWAFKYQDNTNPALGAYAKLDYRKTDVIMSDWDWDTIIWKQVRKLVFNLQKRIYKATKSGKYSFAPSLMRLLQYSTCGIVYAVRKVTTDNTGSLPAGIDFKKAKTPKD